MSHPNDRLPWFRCFPTALLGALAGMEPHIGYTYVTVLLRIYETGGAVSETPDTLSRRTGLPKMRIVDALEYLLEMGKLEQAGDSRFDSRSTHSELAWQHERREEQKKAGKMSAAKRAEKTQHNQRNGGNARSTSVHPGFNHLDLDKEKEKKKEKVDALVWVARDTPEWRAWQRVRKLESVFSTEHQQNGWWFKSQWPPDPIPSPTTKEAAE